MKTRKRYVRAGAACLAALLTVQGMTLPVAAGEEVKGKIQFTDTDEFRSGSGLRKQLREIDGSENDQF